MYSITNEDVFAPTHVMAIGFYISFGCGSAIGIALHAPHLFVSSKMLRRGLLSHACQTCLFWGPNCLSTFISLPLQLFDSGSTSGYFQRFGRTHWAHWGVVDLLFPFAKFLLPFPRISAGIGVWAFQFCTQQRNEVKAVHQISRSHQSIRWANECTTFHMDMEHEWRFSFFLCCFSTKVATSVQQAPTPFKLLLSNRIWLVLKTSLPASAHSRWRNHTGSGRGGGGGGCGGTHQWPKHDDQAGTSHWTSGARSAPDADSIPWDIQVCTSHSRSSVCLGTIPFANSHIPQCNRNHRCWRYEAPPSVHSGHRRVRNPSQICHNSRPSSCWTNLPSSCHSRRSSQRDALLHIQLDDADSTT